MRINHRNIFKTIQVGTAASWETVKLLGEKRYRVQSILNGLVGDTLHAQGSHLAIEMSLLGKPSGGKLCILVHGLFDSETTWRFSQESKKDYGTLLKKDLGFSPLYLRYNSGLHISTNGQELARLLGKAYKNHSETIQEIIFIGHSMGGLVIRSACHYGRRKKAPWVSKVKKIFLLGTPHLGTDLEKIGHLASVILKTIPNPFTRGVAVLGNLRSAGIKDLRFGYLLDEDWQGQKVEALWHDNRHPVPLLEGVDYYVIAATLAKESKNMFSEYFGDGWVPLRSATGRSFRKSKTLPFSPDHFKTFKGLSHLALARNRRVYYQIRKWCRFGPHP